MTQTKRLSRTVPHCPGNSQKSTVPVLVYPVGITNRSGTVRTHPKTTGQSTTAGQSKQPRTRHTEITTTTTRRNQQMKHRTYWAISETAHHTYTAARFISRHAARIETWADRRAWTQ